MVIILEFFRLDDESSVTLAIEKRQIKTIDHAQLYARGAIDNVHFGGQMADGCIIRSQEGGMICEVARDQVLRLERRLDVRN